MQKWWSIFFGAVLFALLAVTAVSPAFGWWLPPNIATFGGGIDALFYVILAFVTFFYILPCAILVWAMWRYAYEPGRRGDYVHGNHKLEIAWTAVPAAILLFIAFAQINTWRAVKYQSQFPEPDLNVQVTAQQWQWDLRYPADTDAFKGEDARARHWAEVAQYDDLHLANELHVWKGANVKVFLKTRDVLHSFYLPNLRLKQDALPGKTIPVWFNVDRANTVRVGDEWFSGRNPDDLEFAGEVRKARALLARADRYKRRAADQEVASDQIAAGADVKEEESERLTRTGARPLAVQLRREAEDLRAQADARHEKAEELLAEANRLREQAARLLGGGTDLNYSWEISCAELCGGRHYAMRGKLFVHPTKEDYEAWLKVARDKQGSKGAANGGTRTASR